MIPMRPDGAGRLRKVSPLQVPDGRGGFQPVVRRRPEPGSDEARTLAAQMQAAVLARRSLEALLRAVQEACPAPQTGAATPPYAQVGMVADPQSTDGIIVRDQD